MKRVYVYAIVDRLLPARTIYGRRIEVRPVSGLFVVIQERRHPIPVRESTLRTQHRIVVRLAREADALLPVRFGAFLPIDELGEVLRERRDALRDGLRLVRRREQMTVRVFGDAASRVADTSPTAATGAAYLAAARRRATGPQPPIAMRIREAVAPMIAAERVTAGRGQVLTVIDHLVASGAVGRYRDIVAGAIADADRRAPAVVVSGPWPPFAFVPDLWP